MMRKLLLALLLVPSLAWADPFGAASPPGTAGTQSALMGCLYTSAGVTLTNGQQSAIPCSAAGAIPTTGGVPDGTASASVNGAKIFGRRVTDGSLQPVGIDSNGNLQVITPPTDPCQTSGIAKASTPINITSATTTALVAVSGTTAVYVCGFSVTVSEVITTANTIQFEYGSGTACATSPTALTGTFGSGGVTAGAPVPITFGGAGQTVMKTPAANGLCAVTAIGATGSFQGILTFVQQ